jgi:dTDP-4-amino-4,6-dideoxygalactose transaminase
VGALAEIGRRRRLAVLYDAAHGLGCSSNGRMLGNFGAAEVLSFHATKVFNTLEGGAVATNDDALAATVRHMRNFGLDGPEQVTCLGINAKMNEVSAAMGLTSLEDLDRFVAINRDHYRRYQSELSNIPGIRVVTYDETERCNYQYIVLEVEDAVAELTRDDIVRVLRAENIIARRYFHPGCHRVEPYRSLPRYADVQLPNTEWLTSRVLAVPTGSGVTSEEVDRVCEVVRFAVAEGRKIHERLVAASGPLHEVRV